MVPAAKKSATKSTSRNVPVMKSSVSNKSSEYVDESDLDDESARGNTDTQNAQLASAKVSSKNENSSKRPATSTESNSTESTSDSGASDDQSSGVENSEVSDDDSDASDESNGDITPMKTSADSSRPRRFAPPAGFQQLTDGDGTSVHSLRSLEVPNASRKQFWYFTAANSVPVTAIREVTLQEIETGKPILEHNGMDYAFIRDSGEASHVYAVLPNDGGSYHLNKGQVDRVYHLQGSVRLPHLLPNQSNHTNSAARVSRAPKHQPKGLKMRFQPAGFGDGRTGTIGSSSESEGESDEGNSSVTRSFQAPQTMNGSSDEDEEMPIAPETTTYDGSETTGKSRKGSSESKKAEGKQSKSVDKISGESIRNVAGKKTKKEKTRSADLDQESPRKKKKHSKRDETTVTSSVPGMTPRQETPILPPSMHTPMSQRTK